MASGGTDLYLSVDLARGLPVAASCLVTVVPLGVAAEMPARELATVLGDRPGDEVGVLEVAGALAARVRRREEPAGDPDGLTGQLPSTRLDVCVPTPGGQQVLLMSFSTSIDPIADAMVALFEAIAASLQWRWA